MRSRIALLALAALGLVPLAAQAPPNPFEAEAPTTLYDFDVGDADVSLFATGTWTAGVAPAVGWLVTRTDDGSLRSLPGYDFPGLESVPFEQQVNLTLSLWLLERYFFETTVSEQIDESTILFGYAGREDETVQSVLVGNTAIGIGAYPFLDFGDETGSVGQDAPGASAAFRTERSTHELMVRFAPSERDEIVYANGGIVSETRVSASEYERNRHFVLPDGGVDFLELYVESPTGDFADGDGRRYRRLDLDTEVVFSLADGAFSLREAPTTRLLVYYEAGGVPIGDAALGSDAYFGLGTDGRPDPGEVRDFSFEAGELGAYAAQFAPVELDGDGNVDDDLDPADLTVAITRGATTRTAFLIHQPGRFAPFAIASTYARAQSAGGTVALEASPGSPYPSSLDLVVSDAREIVTVGSLAADPRAFANRYPLASALAERPVPGIYGPAPAEPPQTPELVFRFVAPAETIVLPEGFIPGSVRIERNGTVETRFVVEDSGRIVFDTPLRRTDVVRVSFRTSAASGAGDLLFASGNRFELASGTRAELALGARLKPARARYSTRADEYPGRLTVSGSMETRSSSWRTPPASELDAHLAGAVSISSPDTAGVLRVTGMNDGTRSIPISPTALFLAPRSLDAGPGPDLTAGGRGILRFSDHLSVNALGDRSYLPYTAEPPAVTAYEYAAGGRGGPYPASTPPDDEYAGTVAVFDYEIASDRSWVAGLLRVDGGRGIDLADARRLVVPYRVVEASPAAAELTFELGAIGEDLDGDGALDAGADALAFRDSSNGVTLDTGAAPPAGVTYSEDADGNGVLDGELPDLVFAHAVADDLTDAGAGWQALVIELSAEDARRLADARALRVVIEPATAGDSVAGKVVVGGLEVYGSAFSVETTGSPPTVTTSVFPETGPQDDRLAAAFPEAAARLTGEDTEQRVLRVGWSGAVAGDIVTLSRGTAVPAADYEELRIYYRSPSAGATGASIVVRASDGAGAFEAELAEPAIVADGAWHELSLALPTDSDAVVRRIDVEIATNGVAEAVVLFDELSFWGPRTSVGAIAQAELAWSPDVELTVGGTTVVSGVGVEQRLLAQTASFPDNPGARRSGLESSTDVSATVLGAQAAAGLDARTASAGTGLQGRHEVAIAPRVVPLRLVDSFRAGYGVLAPGTSHETSFELAIPAIGVIETDWVSDQRDSSRVAWSASASAGGTATRAREPAERRSPGVGLSAHAELGETSAAADGVPPYPVAWAESFTRLAPTASPQQRGASASLEGSLTFARVGLDAGAGSSFDADAASARRGVETSLELGVPWRAGDRFDVEISARREASIETEGAPRPTPADDLAAAAELVADYPLVVAFVPLAELFADDYPARSADLSRGLLASRYRPQLSVRARRGITSSPWSLLVPTGVELSAARPARRDLDAATSSYELSARALLVAPNLFGRLGVRPLFGFYDSDEFQSRARVEVTGGDGAPWTTEIGIDQSTRLIWTDDRSLELETVATTVVPDDGTTQLTIRLAHLRSRPTERFAGAFLPRVLAEADRTIEHESSLTVEYDQTPGDRLLARLEHATSLRFGEAGTIRLHGGFGAGTQTFAGKPGTLVGLRVGIEGRLRL